MALPGRFSNAPHLSDAVLAVQGRALFSDYPLSAFLAEHSALGQSRGLQKGLTARGKVTRLRLRRAIVKEVPFDRCLSLCDDVAFSRGLSADGMWARATVSFNGDATLFGCRLLGEDQRGLKGIVEGNSLVLQLHAWEEDELMLAPLLRSELDGISAMLAQQAQAIADHNDNQIEKVAGFVRDEFETLIAYRQPALQREEEDIARLRKEFLRRVELINSGNVTAIMREIETHGLTEGPSTWRSDDTPATWLKRVGAD